MSNWQLAIRLRDGFGSWNLGFIWNLGIGIWNFVSSVDETLLIGD